MVMTGAFQEDYRFERWGTGSSKHQDPSSRETSTSKQQISTGFSRSIGLRREVWHPSGVRWDLARSTGGLHSVPTSGYSLSNLRFERESRSEISKYLWLDLGAWSSNSASDLVYNATHSSFLTRIFL